jgi:hypothetical protein
MLVKDNTELPLAIEKNWHAWDGKQWALERSIQIEPFTFPALDVRLKGGLVHPSLMGHYAICRENGTIATVGGRPYFKSGDIFLYFFSPKGEWHIGEQLGDELCWMMVRDSQARTPMEIGSQGKGATWKSWDGTQWVLEQGVMVALNNPQPELASTMEPVRSGVHQPRQQRQLLTLPPIGVTEGGEEEAKEKAKEEAKEEEKEEEPLKKQPDAARDADGELFIVIAVIVSLLFRCSY